MKGAKELAEHCREEAARQFGYFGAEEHRSFLSDIAAHLDAKAAIDSAVTGEVGDIAAAHAEHRSHFRCDQMPDSIVRMDTLLVIVQRQAGEMAEYRRHAEADTATLNDARIAARAEVERLKAERAALAQENARLINEVGELDLAAREQRQRAEVLARGIAAYRTGSFTLVQVWENEEGKAVR